ncbi:MAG: nucleoside triphosphate pyrophosphatase [Propionibacteriaceae bacterium]|nr:nucleoside triphosphate pyrophosphatase [Propionibacteriaceae bacterium]
MEHRLILASASPARLQQLRSAGLEPEVIISGVDEDAIHHARPDLLARELANAKGAAVLERVEGDAILIACDSVLEFEGRAHGKPAGPEQAIAHWHRIRGGQGVLHTGHCVVVRSGGREKTQSRIASTVVKFADLTSEEIEAYVATGEPLVVAGGFTMDGFGGAFVTGVEGDPHNVIGISLPLLRQMLLDLGVTWQSLWRPGLTVE